VQAKSGWFAARPSGTEDIYKIYAESFFSADHLRRININSFSLDFSRANGTVNGAITLEAFNGAASLGSISAILGAINTWSTLTLSSATNITSIAWAGTGTSFHPYAMDNFRFAGGSVPEPGSMLLLAGGLCA